MNGYFIFDGLESREFGAVIYDLRIDSAPTRLYDDLEAAGKNGVYLLSKRRFPNVIHSYSGLIYENFESNLTKLRNRLLSREGYKRLSDSFHTDEFYSAAIRADIEIQVSRDRKNAKFTIEFERLPQRFLVSGETPVTVTSPSGSQTTSTVTNPTLMPAYPKLVITGTGNINIGGNRLTIASGTTGETTVDCEIMEAYLADNQGGIQESRNSLVTIQDINYPYFKPGSNAFNLGANITKVVYTPRWWKL